MKKGYIYILTNKSFNRSNWIKIGYSEDVDRRVKELSNTSVPMDYEVYAKYEVPAEKNMDKNLHSIIQRLNPELRISANREFFEIEPWDAYEILHSMALIHGTTDKLWRNPNNSPIVDLDMPESSSEKDLFEQGTLVGDLYNKIKKEIFSMYPDLKLSTTKNYIALKKGNKHNVISLWPKMNSIEVVLHAKLGTIKDESGVIYDISNRMWSAAQYAFRFQEENDMDVVRDLIRQTYLLVK